MNLNRKFQQQVGDKNIDFDVTYDLEKHNFIVNESDQPNSYRLVYDMQTKIWKTTDGPAPSIPISDLALLVQKNFGHFM